MLEIRIARRINSSAQQHEIALGGGTVINLFADAHNVEVVSAPAVSGRVAAGGVDHALFTVADCTDAEILRQAAIAAFFAVEQQIFNNFLNRKERSIEKAFNFFCAEKFHNGTENIKTAILPIEQ